MRTREHGAGQGVIDEGEFCAECAGGRQQCVRSFIQAGNENLKTMRGGWFSGRSGGFEKVGADVGAVQRDAQICCRDSVAVESDQCVAAGDHVGPRRQN